MQSKYGNVDLSFLNKYKRDSYKVLHRSITSYNMLTSTVKWESSTSIMNGNTNVHRKYVLRAGGDQIGAKKIVSFQATSSLLTSTQIYTHHPKFCRFFALVCGGLPVFQRHTVLSMGTGHNGDKSERRQQKRRHIKTATLQNGDNSGQNGHNLSQNGDKHWLTRRRILVKTATVIGRNGDNSQSKRQHYIISLILR